MSDFYAAVFGAGITGTAIAAALRDKGKSVLLIDPHVLENAPGAPAGLVNPATGRHARLSWRSEECMPLLRHRIEAISSHTGKVNLISDSGVLRPAVNENLAQNFLESLNNYEWPKGWIQWLDPKETQGINRYVGDNYGALWLDCGFTVFVDRYLNAYRQYLREKGTECRYEPANYNEITGKDSFRIHFDSGYTATAEHVIVAAGWKTPQFCDWEYLKLHLVKGQIAVYEADHDLDWQHGVSAMGYSLRRGERTIIVGSTYEHKFENTDTTNKALIQLSKKRDVMLPGLNGRASLKHQLAGVRVTTPNKLPVIGRHKEKKNLCIYSGMGSKGLLYSEYTAGILANHLVDGTEIEKDLSTDRFTS